MTLFFCTFEALAYHSRDKLTHLLMNIYLFNTNCVYFLLQAEAFHILVPITSREAEAPAALLKLEAVKKQCLQATTPEKGLEVFSEAASKMSSCPSSQKGGFLGRFKRGAMVPPFDDAVFAQDTVPGTPVGPVLTMFGAHLIWVKSISNA